MGEAGRHITEVRRSWWMATVGSISVKANRSCKKSLSCEGDNCVSSFRQDLEPSWLRYWYWYSLVTCSIQPRRTSPPPSERFKIVSNLLDQPCSTSYYVFETSIGLAWVHVVVQIYVLPCYVRTAAREEHVWRHPFSPSNYQDYRVRSTPSSETGANAAIAKRTGTERV
jgi:hypothetical protein